MVGTRSVTTREVADRVAMGVEAQGKVASPVTDLVLEVLVHVALFVHVVLSTYR